MGFYALKFLVVALVVFGGLLAFPWGALQAARRARRKYARVPLARDLTGARVAGLLLHREGLSEIRVEAGARSLDERYAPHAARIELSDEVARLASVYAAATAAFYVAKTTLHADGDPDFARSFRRATPLAILVNALPVAVFVGLLIPGEGRAVLLLVVPVMLVFIVAYTMLSLPAERRAADRALALLVKHGFVADKTEREALRSVLAARAALALAAPLTRCYWLSWAF